MGRVALKPAACSTFKLYLLYFYLFQILIRINSLFSFYRKLPKLRNVESLPNNTANRNFSLIRFEPNARLRSTLLLIAVLLQIYYIDCRHQKAHIFTRLWEMMKFVDVTNDIAFRKIFGNENKKISLISFLNAVINLPENNLIVDVDILNPYQLPKLAGGKSTIVDVKAKDKKGNTFIVEMQVSEPEFFQKRILYYTSQSYVGQIHKGSEYDKLQPVYFIGILEFKVGNNPNYISCHRVIDVETGEHIVRDVEFNFIELPKFEKEINEMKTNIDQWTYFIKNAENLDVIPENVTDEGLKEAYMEADKHNWSQQELDDYERAEIKERDEIGIVNLIVKKAEKKAQKQRDLEIGKVMKDNNEPIDKIVKFTGLTKEEIEKL